MHKSSRLRSVTLALVITVICLMAYSVFRGCFRTADEQARAMKRKMDDFGEKLRHEQEH